MIVDAEGTVSHQDARIMKLTAVLAILLTCFVQVQALPAANDVVTNASDDMATSPDANNNVSCHKPTSAKQCADNCLCYCPENGGGLHCDGGSFCHDLMECLNHCYC